jgi:plastocyanin
MQTERHLVAAVLLGFSTVAGCAPELTYDSDGTGGTGGTVQNCTLPSECPDPLNDCLSAICLGGVCGTAYVALNIPAPMQVPGNCKTEVCDGSGAVTAIDDDTDIENDNMSCTMDTCKNGAPIHAPLPGGTPCMEGGGQYCNTAGSCVECVLSSDCMSGICTNYECVEINGCSGTGATDMTGMADVAVDFGGALGNNYGPKCLKVSVGAYVTFNGNFTVYPLMGGEVVNGMKLPASSGPFVPMTNTGMMKTFHMPSLGNFPYYSDFHALAGMTGVVFVVP